MPAFRAPNLLLTVQAAGEPLTQETSVTPQHPASGRAGALIPAVRRAGLLALCAALGTGPAQAQAPTAPKRVYVSSEKDHRIYVFDAQGRAQGAIETCKRPRHMMFGPGAHTLYVACGDSNMLGIVDTAQRSQTGTLALGESPEIFGLSPDGRTAYVSIEDENVMAAYDLGSRRKLFEVKTGAEPEGVLVTPDGKQAYVASEVANAVHLVDLAQRRIVKTVRVGKRPRRMVLAAGGKELWVSNELDASVSILSTTDLAVLHTLAFSLPGLRASDITPVGMVASPDGATVWVALGRANHVAAVDRASRRVRQTVLVGRRAWGLALDAQGKTLYVANGQSDDMTLVDTAAGKALRTVAVGRVPHTVLVEP